jgi:RNA recognition motif-containing protein
MIAPSIAVTALLLHVEIERSGIEAAHPTAVIERKLRHHASPFSLTDVFSAPPSSDTRMKDADEEGAVNTGSNLFVTGIHPRLSESDVSRLFDKYGEVESCSIMLDPHTKESRGFGFVKMVTPEQADAAKEGLQGEVIEGRTLSIEKARRARPRTPTPGKYFGPPKRGKRAQLVDWYHEILTTSR